MYKTWKSYLWELEERCNKINCILPFNKKNDSSIKLDSRHHDSYGLGKGNLTPSRVCLEMEWVNFDTT